MGKLFYNEDHKSSKKIESLNEKQRQAVRTVKDAVRSANVGGQTLEEIAGHCNREVYFDKLELQKEGKRSMIEVHTDTEMGVMQVIDREVGEPLITVSKTEKNDAEPPVDL